MATIGEVTNVDEEARITGMVHSHAQKHGSYPREMRIGRLVHQRLIELYASERRWVAAPTPPGNGFQTLIIQGVTCVVDPRMDKAGIFLVRK